MATYLVPAIGTFSWQPTVLATQNTPPASPAKGDRYIVGGVPTGAWSGYGWYIATYTGSAWSFDQPSEGWRAYDVNANGDKLFNGTAWQNATPAAHASTHQSGGADAIRLDDLAAAEDNTDLNATTGAHGLLPKLGGGTSNFLRADGTWAAPGSGGLGYTLQFLATTSPMTDATTYYFGGQAFTLTELDGAQRVYVPKAGTIKYAYIHFFAVTVGTGENISVYIRKNSTSDTLVATVGNTNQLRIFSNIGLSVSVSQGDFVEVKIVCPTWATNPLSNRWSGIVYVE